jgi:hypothetical protein
MCFICEARAEAKYLTIEPLFLVTVDSQKAFDVVDHIIMLDTYYENIQNHPLWSVVNNLYTGLVSKWSVDCVKFSASVGRIAYSKSFEMTGVTAIPL